MAWNTTGIAPALASKGMVLADTGPLSVTALNLTIVSWADDDCIVELVLRDALNTVDLVIQKLFLPSGTIVLPAIPISVTLNQRIIVRAFQVLTGNIQVSLLT